MKELMAFVSAGIVECLVTRAKLLQVEMQTNTSLFPQLLSAKKNLEVI